MSALAPNPVMTELRRLPEHVTATLLRALMTLPRRPDSRLILRKTGYGRPPSWDEKTEYDVLFQGRQIGRVWHFDRYDDPKMRGPWHWHWCEIAGRPAMTGHAPTLKAAMAGFRQAWDATTGGIGRSCG